MVPGSVDFDEIMCCWCGGACSANSRAPAIAVVVVEGE